MSQNQNTARAERLADHLSARYGWKLKHTQALTAIAISDGSRNRHEISGGRSRGAPCQAGKPSDSSGIPIEIGDIARYQGTYAVVECTRSHLDDGESVDLAFIRHPDGARYAVDQRLVSALPRANHPAIRTWCHPLPVDTVLLSVPSQSDDDGTGLTRHTGPKAIGIITSARRNSSGEWIYGVDFPKSGVSIFLDQGTELYSPGEGDRAGYHVLQLGPTPPVDMTSAPAIGRFARLKDAFFEIAEILPQQPSSSRWRVLDTNLNLLEVVKSDGGWEVALPQLSQPDAIVRPRNEPVAQMSASSAGTDAGQAQPVEQLRREAAEQIK